MNTQMYMPGNGFPPAYINPQDTRLWGGWGWGWGFRPWGFGMPFGFGLGFGMPFGFGFPFFV